MKYILTFIILTMVTSCASMKEDFELVPYDNSDTGTFPVREYPAGR